MKRNRALLPWNCGVLMSSLVLIECNCGSVFVTLKKHKKIHAVIFQPKKNKINSETWMCAYKTRWANNPNSFNRPVIMSTTNQHDLRLSLTTGIIISPKLAGWPRVNRYLVPQTRSGYSNGEAMGARAWFRNRNDPAWAKFTTPTAPPPPFFRRRHWDIVAPSLPVTHLLCLRGKMITRVLV